MIGAVTPWNLFTRGEQLPVSSTLGGALFLALRAFPSAKEAMMFAIATALSTFVLVGATVFGVTTAKAENAYSRLLGFVVERVWIRTILSTIPNSVSAVTVETDRGLLVGAFATALGSSHSHLLRSFRRLDAGCKGCSK